MPLEPCETRPRSNFPELRVVFPGYDQLSYNINAWHRLFDLAVPQLNTRSHTCQHHAEINYATKYMTKMKLAKISHCDQIKNRQMANIKLLKQPRGMVIFWIQLRRTYRDLSSQTDPAKEIEREVVRTSIKTDVSRKLKSQ